MRLSAVLTLAALCAVTPWSSPAQAASCVEFQGIKHCPIGDARLKLVNDGSRLAVTGLGDDGNDGVSSHFRSASLWQAEMRIPQAQEGHTLKVEAMSEGVAASTLNLKLSGQGLVAQTQFTGGNGAYAVEVLSEGKVVARSDDLLDGDVIILRPFPVPLPFPWPEPWPPGPIFGQGRQGECFWRLPTDLPTEVFTSSGSLGVGDEIRMVERVDGSGHYPYAGFDGMRLQTNGPAIVISEETTISNGF